MFMSLRSTLYSGYKTQKMIEHENGSYSARVSKVNIGNSIRQTCSASSHFKLVKAPLFLCTTGTCIPSTRSMSRGNERAWIPIVYVKSNWSKVWPHRTNPKYAISDVHFGCQCARLYSSHFHVLFSPESCMRNIRVLAASYFKRF